MVSVALVAGNTFTGNQAMMTGSAIYSTYCNGRRSSFRNNRFSGNMGGKFPGNIGLNAGQCPPPDLSGCTFANPDRALAASR